MGKPDDRALKEPVELSTPLMEVFALEFHHFDGRDRAELRGTVSVIDDRGAHTIFSSDRFQTIGLGRFDALRGADFSRGERPIDVEYDVFIHTDLEDRTHGELFLMDPDLYEALKDLGDKFKERGPNHNEVLVWNTGQYGPSEIMAYDSLIRAELVGPHCALDVLFVVYHDAVSATVQLTFMESSKQDFDVGESAEDVTSDVCGKVTARNTVLTDPEAFSTLFARKAFDRVSLVHGGSIPLSKPSVVVPTKSSLLLDLELEFCVKSKHGSCHKLVKTNSSFEASTLQTFEKSVDVGDTAMLRVEVKWLKLKP